LNISPQWLDTIIRKESAWNPRAIAKIPYNKARLDKGQDLEPKYAKGLIQFIDSTAAGLGFANSQELIDQYPDITSQVLNPVYNYFRQEAPFKDENDFYLSVFYPAYRGKPLTMAVSDSITASNPTIKTVGDYINYVKGGFTKNNFYIMSLLILAGSVFLISKIFK
jgi:hypothetical protein